MYKYKTGDEIIITSGKDKGKGGKIEKILLNENRVVVNGVNIYKRHRKVTKNQPAGIYEVARPISISKIVLICPKCSKKTRVGFKITNKTKNRFCKKCKGTLT